ncbi:MAG TPA: SDR family NAD(P)-dependent oxidoreductase [Solirubrobacteraceae bacterium]|jgi:short-subunit dehydrogenase
MQIQGSNVLLTGASGGLGQAIARELAAKGAKLILTGRRVEVLEPLAAELPGARTLAVDLNDRNDLQRLLTEAGEVDILVANAGLPGSGKLESFSVEQIDKAIEVNLTSPIVLARELAPQMIARGSGHLLFVSSLSGKAAASGGSIYSATKFGLRGFALALRGDMRPHGVGVSVVLPGFIRDAGMFAESGAKLPTGVGTRTPKDVAEAVAKAIERNVGELGVAPLGVRLGATLASVAPEFAAAVTRRSGGDEIAAQLASAQLEKR